MQHVKHMGYPNTVNPLLLLLGVKADVSAGMNILKLNNTVCASRKLFYHKGYLGSVFNC